MSFLQDCIRKFHCLRCQTKDYPPNLRQLNGYIRCLMIYQDENHWAKSGIEREDESYSNLGAVVTDRGYSDWSMSPIDPRRDTFYLRLNRRSEDFLFEYSDTGSSFQPIRMFHLHKASDELRFGLYACSPGKSSFTVKFSNLQMGEGTWAEHRP